jgi:hypothetical protein
MKIVNLTPNVLAELVVLEIHLGVVRLDALTDVAKGNDDESNCENDESEVGVVHVHMVPCVGGCVKKKNRK